jgi:DNA (cytosine-5)-methyltransferase 1
MPGAVKFAGRSRSWSSCATTWGQSVDAPVPTIAANGTHIGLAQPVVVNMKGRSTASDSNEPLPTQTAHAGHLFVADPVIMNGRKGNKAKAVSTEPVPTLDTKGGVWLAEPMVMATGAGPARSIDDPMPTITTGGAGSDDPGCARPMLVEPFILNRHGENGGTRAHGVEEPAPTADCRGAGYLIEPFIVSAAHGDEASERDPSSRRTKSADEPLGTIHAGGGNFAVVEPSFMLSRQGEGAPRSIEEPTPTQVAKHSHVLISPYYGSGSGETCKSAEQPLDTVTAKARFGMVVPITHADGSDRARDVETDPLATITTAHRGELAFITAQFGEREGQLPRIHDIGQPAPAITATGHVNLVEPTETYDILFRMLEPHELAAAMGFSDEEARYEFAGTKTEKIKQIGNAVSVRKMKACVGAIMADAAVPAKTVAKKRRAA